MTERSGRREGSAGRRLLAAPAVLCAALTLAACGSVAGRFDTASPTTTTAPAKPARTVAQTPASEREHERILSSYGGAYDDPKLEALISKTVDRLVAASDRPDQAYRVTILNSGAVNAFALPTGQLYVTRGLVALASDTSELSSVLSHEMAHVLAKHASIREDQARQAAVVTRVVTDMSNDPDLTALALAKTKLTMASFSRSQEFEADGIGVGISARAHFDPYGASRFLNAMERNAALKAGKTSLDPRAQDFLSSHPATPERVQNAQNSARQFSSPESGERDQAAGHIELAGRQRERVHRAGIEDRHPVGLVGTVGSRDQAVDGFADQRFQLRIVVSAAIGGEDALMLALARRRLRHGANWLGGR